MNIRILTLRLLVLPLLIIVFTLSPVIISAQPTSQDCLDTDMLLAQTGSLGSQSQQNYPSSDNTGYQLTDTTRLYRSYFASYMNSALLMPINIYTFLTPKSGVHALKGVSMCMKKFSWSDFELQLKPEPSLVYGVGLLDNIIALEGSANGKSEVGYSIDYLSGNAAYVVPINNYQAYGAIGARLALSQQPLFQDEYDYGGSVFTFVQSFNTTDSTRSYTSSRFPDYSADVFAKAGIRIYQGWFLSGALGIRYVPDQTGKWYLKSDVQDWQNGTIPWEPDEWVIDEFPKVNTLLGGATLYFNFTISPYF